MIAALPRMAAPTAGIATLRPIPASAAATSACFAPDGNASTGS